MLSNSIANTDGALSPLPPPVLLQAVDSVEIPFAPPCQMQSSAVRRGDLKRLLFISYAYPPVGGAGVQRPLKFSKYLAMHGWQPTVLTVSNPSVPVLDSDLIREIPADLQVLRARTWEPPYAAKRGLSTGAATSKGSVFTWLKRHVRALANRWLQPDPQILWNHSAYRLAVRDSQQHAYHAILVSGPPFSSFLLGCQLKRRLGIPLVLDFRDEWMLAIRHLENHGTVPKLAARQRAQYRSVLQGADALVTTTRASASELRAATDELHRSIPIEAIYNGFDPSDFRLQEACEANSSQLSLVTSTRVYSDQIPKLCFHLVYAGTSWNLTDVRPLLEGLRCLESQEAEVGRRIQITFIGRRTPDQDRWLRDFSSWSTIRLELLDYLPHREVLWRQQQADAVGLWLADVEGTERVVPGKLFECLALGKPILAILPSGECFDLMRQQLEKDPHRGHGLYRPSDRIGIASWFTTMPKKRDVLSASPQSVDALQWCSRPKLTEQLAGLLDHVSCRAPGCGQSKE